MEFEPVITAAKAVEKYTKLFRLNFRPFLIRILAAKHIEHILPAVNLDIVVQAVFCYFKLLVG